MPPNTATLPADIEETVATVNELHAKHYREAAPSQRRLAAIIAALARPAFVVVLTALVIGWIALNLGLLAMGHEPPDPPPFAYLSGVASLAALYMASMILSTQRHDDELAAHRDQLNLELAILSEQKSAKIIQLLEEARRSDPARSSGRDVEAEEMAISAERTPYWRKSGRRRTETRAAATGAVEDSMLNIAPISDELWLPSVDPRGVHPGEGSSDQQAL